ncbi:alg9-like mannosyltransferase family domain-containing protein [Ditylenchus destructor]|uniref:Mannosyltransferase n=1 Tax=Ditylenchus destructor TaxID=166010 RepID=A0AAD4RDC3_9BILA|nr:alg9-like mannosyltransferase family domain-containing protein [Ditylenchus destructor]
MLPCLSSLKLKASYGYFLVFRILNVFCASTWFVPDEYFQSVEVAYRMVYGKGMRTWEWKPNNALRSAFHPTLYAIPFWVLKLLACDSRLFLNWIPHLIQACIFAVADIYYYRFLQKLPGLKSRDKTIAMLFYLTNWFILYCSTRTLSNTIEAALSVVALYWYQSFTKTGYVTDRKKTENYEEAKLPNISMKDARLCALCVSLAVIMRPTSVLIWFPLFLTNFLESPSRWSYLFRCHLPCSLIILSASVIVDSFYYGKVTVSLWNFTKFNFLKGGSSHFGSNVWFWYIVNGLPTLFTILCLPMATFIAKQLRTKNNVDNSEEDSLLISTKIQLPSRFFWVSVFYVIFHSAIAHKEHRFLLPIIPLVIPYLVAEIEELFGLYGTRQSTYHMKEVFKNVLIWSTVGLNLVLAMYFGVVHQRGPNVATNFIAKEILQRYPNRTVYIAQLMPCFSMPQYAALHPYSVEIRMLDFEEDSDENSVDEAEEFHNDPLGWLRLNWAEDFLKTDVVVAYEKTYERMSRFLEMKGFYVVQRIILSKSQKFIMTESIQNLNKPKDAFAQLEDEEGTHQGFVHIRIQQRTGRKTITTVQGIPTECNTGYDLKKIVRYLKKEYNCNGTIVEHPEYGEVIQLTGDQRQHIKDFLCKVGIVKEENCKIHGF